MSIEYKNNWQSASKKFWVGHLHTSEVKSTWDNFRVGHLHPSGVHPYGLSVCKTIEIMFQGWVYRMGLFVHHHTGVVFRYSICWAICSAVLFVIQRLGRPGLSLSVSLFVCPSLPPSLSPSLSLSLPPSLPQSLPHSLPPSLPPSRPPSGGVLSVTSQVSQNAVICCALHSFLIWRWVGHGLCLSVPVCLSICLCVSFCFFDPLCHFFSLLPPLWHCLGLHQCTNKARQGSWVDKEALAQEMVAPEGSIPSMINLYQQRLGQRGVKHFHRLQI